MADREAGEVRILALRMPEREYIITESSDEASAQEVVEFLKEGGGGYLYKFEYQLDKYNDVIPRCTKLGNVIPELQ